MIAEDDLLVEHFIAQGTHRGSVMGEVPTGQHVVLRGINIFRWLSRHRRCWSLRRGVWRA
jgi:predicted ester cyclase